MKPVCTKKLWAIFHEKSREDENLGAMCGDTFATACYLHYMAETKIERVAARKLIQQVLDVLGWENRKTLFNRLFDSLPDNELLYAEAVPKHSEVRKLVSQARAIEEQKQGEDL